MSFPYFKFASLPEDVRAINKIRSKARYDCVAFSNDSGYKGLTDFVNPKGQMYLYKTPCKDFISTASKRLAEWSLNNGSLNLSSIYIEDMDCQEIGYGYPNSHPFLGLKKIPNPLYPFRNDAYLFIVNKDYSEIELLVIPDGRNLIHSYYQKMIDGGYDDMVKALRGQSKPFYRYDGIISL